MDTNGFIVVCAILHTVRQDCRRSAFFLFRSYGHLYIQQVYLALFCYVRNVHASQIPVGLVWSSDARLVVCFLRTSSCTSSRRGVRAPRFLRLFFFTANATYTGVINAISLQSNVCIAREYQWVWHGFRALRVVQHALRVRHLSLR